MIVIKTMTVIDGDFNIECELQSRCSRDVTIAGLWRHNDKAENRICMCTICYTSRKDVLPWKSTMRLISASRSRIGALTCSPPHHHRTQSSHSTEPSWENKRFLKPELVLSSPKRPQCRFGHPPIRKIICCATTTRNTMSATTRNSSQLSELSRSSSLRQLYFTWSSDWNSFFGLPISYQTYHYHVMTDTWHLASTRYMLIWTI